MNKLITISSVLLTAAAVKAQTPNIVFILADDWVMETSRPLIPNLNPYS